jgi:hypothetical protein
MMGNMLATVLGGMVEITTHLWARDFSRLLTPRTCYAILRATLLGSLWEWHWGPTLDVYFDNSPWIHSSAPTLWERVKFTFVASFFIGEWIQTLVYVLANPSANPTIQIRCQISTLVQAVVYFLALLVLTATFVRS